MHERRLSFLLLSPLLVIGIGGFILTTALSRTIGQPEQAKELIHKSGLYQAVIPQQVADAQKANPDLANLPLDNPDVQKVLASSLDSGKIQQEGDQAVDGLYAWLEGKNDRPKIAIDVNPNLELLASSAADYAAKRAAGLPACSPGLADYNTFMQDPLGTNCLPPAIGPEMVRQTVHDAVVNNPALASNTQLTENDVKLTNGQTIMDSLSTAPTWYQRAQLLPLIFAGLAGLCALIILIILRPARGIKSIGKHLLSVGITLALCAWLITWGIKKGYDVLIPKSDNPNIGEALMKLTNAFNDAYRDNILALCLYAVGAGLVLYALGYVLVKIFSRGAAKKSAVEAYEPSPPTSLAAKPPVTSFTPLPPPAVPAGTTATVKKSTRAKSKASKTTTKKKSAASKTKKK